MKRLASASRAAGAACELTARHSHCKAVAQTVAQMNDCVTLTLRRRSGIFFKQQLLPQPLSQQAFLPGLYRLEARPRGALSNLVPISLPHAAEVCTGRAACEDGTVLLSVKAVGINFRDVLNVLGMYPGVFCRCHCLGLCTLHLMQTQQLCTLSM